jgi:hypothetical protein
LVERGGSAETRAWELSGRGFFFVFVLIVVVFGCDAEAGSDGRDLEEAGCSLP